MSNNEDGEKRGGSKTRGDSDKDRPPRERSRSRSPVSRRRGRVRSRSRSYSRSRSPPTSYRRRSSRSPSPRGGSRGGRRRSRSRSRSPPDYRGGRSSDRDPYRRDRDGYRDRGPSSGYGSGGPRYDDYYVGRGGRGGPPPPPRDFEPYGPRGGGPYPPPRGAAPPFRGDRGGGRSEDRRRGEGMPGISLLVRNVGPHITQHDLQMAFGRIGNVRDVYIPRDYHSQQPKGFAFIEYANIEMAREARDEMDRFRIKGCELEVVFAQERRKTPNEMRGRVADPSNDGGGGGRGLARSSSFERHRQRQREGERSRDRDRPKSSPEDENKTETGEANEGGRD
ncbi:RNP-1 like RNA-binding protein [Nitzschia inconspicua]|uniref:RNP-1 like RNA-binding protein n=1 Tax=Nitzschia inconspicua TaxID=303405 RepID=A0A9K3LU36_9STRA|nr:RNP-1 like RNA-binding protein [Nitzschia inconspicua]